MACDFSCDGCGISLPATFTDEGFHPPENWYGTIKDGEPFVACSESCVERAKSKAKWNATKKALVNKPVGV